MSKPTAKRQTVQANEFVQTWQFLHAAGTCPRPTSAVAHIFIKPLDECAVIL